MLFKYQFDLAGSRVKSVAASRLVAVLYHTGSIRERCIALFWGVCWTADLIKALLFISFVVHWCQMNLLASLWVRNGSKLNHKSLEGTVKSFQLENLY